MTLIASAWLPYGLRGDPFFQEPLVADDSEGSAHSAALFVGREEELQLVGRQIVGAVAEGSSRAVVQGVAGVGKTSFVNRVKAALTDPRRREDLVLTHTMPIPVRGKMIPQKFEAAVLRTLLLIHSTQRETLATPKKKSGKLKTPHTKVSSRESAFWLRLTRVLVGEDSLSGGMTLGPIGVTQQRTRLPAEIHDLPLYEEMAQAFEYLSARGTRRILLHVNNLENLSRADAAAAADLIQDLRDDFLIPHSHWIFVGATGIEESIFRATPQVSGIIPLVVTLPALTAEQVGDLLTRRYERLARGLHWTPPVAPEAAATLYARYHGDLRNFLRVLSNAAQQLTVASPPVPLTEPRIVATMAARYRSDLTKLITTDSVEQLAKTVQGQRSDVRIRATDVATATGLTASAASLFMNRLQARGVVVLDRTEGRSVWYRLSGDTTVALGLS